MEWKVDCYKVKDQKNIVVKNKKENPNEFSGKLRFNNAKQYLCLDVDVTCQLMKQKGSIKSCDSLLIVFNTSDKKKLKDVNSEHIHQQHFIEFKSGDLSGAFSQIISTVKILGFKNQLNYGYVVRNPKKKLYAQAQSSLKKYNITQKGKILFKVLKSNETINLN